MTLLARSLPVVQGLERLTGVQKVMGSIFVRDSDFCLSHASIKLNIPSFLFLSELKIYHLSFFNNVILPGHT